VVSQNGVSVKDDGFCVWVAGEPASVVGTIARAVALELAHHRRVEEAGPGPDWLAAAEPTLRLRLLAHLARALTAHGVVVVLATGFVDALGRAEMRDVVSRLIEVGVGEAPAGDSAPFLAPEVGVPGDGARAGESARVVLRHLAAAGWSEPLDEYSDDDEAAVSGRLQAFGYL
jgi:hypothetical protein